MALNCTAGATYATDFTVYGACAVDEHTRDIVNIVRLCLASLVLVCMLVAWLALAKRLRAKPGLARALVAGAPVYVLLSWLRPLLGAINPAWTGRTNLGVSLLTHGAMAAAGWLGVAFIYFQARLLERSAFGRDSARFQAWYSRHAKPIVLAIGAVQTLGFFLGAVPGFYVPDALPPRLFYLGTLIFLDVTCIPFLAAVSLSIYRRLTSDAGFNKPRYQALARTILLISLFCIASAFGTLTLSAAGCADAWPFIPALVPMTADAFFGFVFFLIARRPDKAATRAHGATTGGPAQFTPSSSTESTVVPTTQNTMAVFVDSAAPV